MSLTKRFIHPPRKAYEEGAVVPDLHHPFSDLPYLSTFNRGKDGDISSLFMAAPGPEELILRFKLERVPLMGKTVTAQFKIDGHLWKPCRFYELRSIHENNHDIFYKTQWLGIDFIFEGTVSYRYGKEECVITSSSSDVPFKILCARGEKLFSYRFCIPEQEHYIQEQVSYRDKSWLVHMAPYVQGVNITPLIPYGGYIPDVLDVTRICQTFAVLVDGGFLQTRLALYTQIFCNNKGIQLNSPQCHTRYHLCADPALLPTISLSLGGWLVNGYLHICIQPVETEEPLVYQSRQFRQTDPASGTVDVFFVRQDK
jgi:hypothetical protein